MSAVGGVEMRWVRGELRDATEQLLEYAENGRLVAVGVDRLRSGGNPLIYFTVIVSMMSAGFGALFAIVLHDAGSSALVVAGLLVATIGIGVLVAAAGSLHARTREAAVVRVTPGAVLPPDLVRVGNWIQRGGVWVRVDEIGRDGGDRVTALLSTGEVVHLESLVTIAGGQFRPAADSVESLRR